MVSFIPESQRERHKAIDQTLELTSEMLRDEVVVSSELGGLAARQLQIMDSYLYVPYKSHGRLRTQSKYLVDTSIPIVAVSEGEKVILDGSMPTMHREQKVELLEFTDALGITRGSVGLNDISNKLKKSFSGVNHPLQLPEGAPSGTFVARAEADFQVIHYDDNTATTIPRVIEGAPIVLMSEDSEMDPVKQALAMVHSLTHVQQFLENGPIEPAVLYSLNHHREAEAIQTTRSLANALRRRSNNPLFRHNPALKKV